MNIKPIQLVGLGLACVALAIGAIRPAAILFGVGVGLVLFAVARWGSALWRWWVRIFEDAPDD